MRHVSAVTPPRLHLNHPPVYANARENIQNISIFFFFAPRFVVAFNFMPHFVTGRRDQSETLENETTASSYAMTPNCTLHPITPPSLPSLLQFTPLHSLDNSSPSNSSPPTFFDYCAYFGHVAYFVFCFGLKICQRLKNAVGAQEERPPWLLQWHLLSSLSAMQREKK